MSRAHAKLVSQCDQYALYMILACANDNVRKTKRAELARFRACCWFGKGKVDAYFQDDPRTTHRIFLTLKTRPFRNLPAAPPLPAAETSTQKLIQQSSLIPLPEACITPNRPRQMCRPLAPCSCRTALLRPPIRQDAAHVCRVCSGIQGCHACTPQNAKQKTNCATTASWPK